MNLEIKTEFTAHPIGQGLFYSGKVGASRDGNPDRIFNFVFDCGSGINRLNNLAKPVIQNYRDKENKGDINLLVISHLDSDHFNGLAILTEGRKVKKLILPFIPYEERLYLAIHAAGNEEENRDGPNSLNPDLDPVLDPLDFILTPIQTLKDAEIIDNNTEIIFITEPSKENGPTKTSDKDFNDSEPSKDFDFKPNGEYITGEEKEILINELLDSGINNDKTNFISCSSSFHLITPLNLRILDFIFYRKKLGDEKFQETYNAYVRDKLIDYSIEAKGHSDEDYLIAIIELKENPKKERSYRDILKEVFEELKKDGYITSTKTSATNPNTTALSMMHRESFYDETIYSEHANCSLDTEHQIETLPPGKPKLRLINKTTVDRLIIDRTTKNKDGSFIGQFYSFEKDNSTNTLLTSDSFLKTKSNVEDFLAHYKEFINEVTIFQIPHHGSKNNSSSKLIKDVNFRYCFINCDPNVGFGRYKTTFPHKESIKRIVNNNKGDKILMVDAVQHYKTRKSYTIRDINFDSNEQSIF